MEECQERGVWRGSSVWRGGEKREMSVEREEQESG